jgi:hypothetical protein
MKVCKIHFIHIETQKNTINFYSYEFKYVFKIFSKFSINQKSLFLTELFLIWGIIIIIPIIILYSI